MKIIKAKSADELWLAGARLLMSDEVRITGSRSGKTHELLNVGFVLEDPRERWVISRRPAMNPAFAIAEVVWILQGRNDSRFLNYFNRKLQKYQGKGDIYHGAYGHRLRFNLGRDQLLRAYKALKSNPNSRQVVLQIWDGRRDLPDSQGQPIDPDIPCNVISMLKVRENSLYWSQIMRSNDLFLGLPHNLVQFTTLHEVLAGWLEIKVGPYVHYCDSLHVYKKDLANITTASSTNGFRNNDSLRMTYDLSKRFFAELSFRIDLFVSCSLKEKEHFVAATWREAPRAFQNMLNIVAAEAAWRRRWKDLARSIVARCTNPALSKLWINWRDRFA